MFVDVLETLGSCFGSRTDSTWRSINYLFDCKLANFFENYCQMQSKRDPYVLKWQGRCPSLRWWFNLLQWIWQRYTRHPAASSKRSNLRSTRYLCRFNSFHNSNLRNWHVVSEGATYITGIFRTCDFQVHRSCQDLKAIADDSLWFVFSSHQIFLILPTSPWPIRLASHAHRAAFATPYILLRLARNDTSH